MNGLDFTVLCERYGRDRLPYPLRVRTSAEYDDQYRRMRAEASARVDARFDDGLDTALRIVTDPLVRVESRGETIDSGGTKFRTHAAVRHGLAAVLTQAPGIDHRAGGAITIELCAPRTVAHRVVAPLPHNRAGRIPAARIERPHRSGVGMARSSVLGTATREMTSAERYREFFQRPRTATGEIIIARGAAVDNRPDSDAIAFHWMDFESDGRYIVRPENVIEVQGVDRSALAAVIDRHVHEALER